MIIWVVQPDGYKHSHVFDIAAESFSLAMECEITHQLPVTDDKVLVFGPHLLPGIKGVWPRNMILFNAEQLSSQFFAGHDAYLRILGSGCYEIWDYSRNNIEELARRDIHASLCEIGWMPCMTKNNAWIKKKVAQDIDILFAGSINERRQKILRILQENCNLKTAFGIYGDDLHDLIERSRIVLNMHFYDQSIFEIFRCSQMMANRKFIVSEKGRDIKLEEKYRQGIWFCDYSHLAAECLRLLQGCNDRLRSDVAEKGFRIFSKIRQTKYLEGLL